MAQPQIFQSQYTTLFSIFHTLFQEINRIPALLLKKKHLPMFFSTNKLIFIHTMFGSHPIWIQSLGKKELTASILTGKQSNG